MFFPQCVFVGSLIPLALHRAKQVAVVNDWSVVLKSFIEVLLL
jgi:hypothetical protein